MPEPVKHEETNGKKRFCVTWIQRSRDPNVKPLLGREHSYFTGIDQADAEDQFWDERPWKPPVKKIEILSIEPI